MKPKKPKTPPPKKSKATRYAVAWFDRDRQEWRFTKGEDEHENEICPALFDGEDEALNNLASHGFDVGTDTQIVKVNLEWEELK